MNRSTLSLAGAAHAGTLGLRLKGLSLMVLPLIALPMLAATPAQADRIRNPIAVFAGLDKITGRIIAFEVNINETVQFGSLQITPRVCWTRPATEQPQTTSFVEVDEVGNNNDYRRIFSGWMYAASPGLHGVEHAIYDVWTTDCKGGTEVIASRATCRAMPPQPSFAATGPPEPSSRAHSPPPMGASMSARRRACQSRRSSRRSASSRPIRLRRAIRRRSTSPAVAVAAADNAAAALQQRHACLMACAAIRARASAPPMEGPAACQSAAPWSSARESIC
jgi:hypothetical protein